MRLVDADSNSEYWHVIKTFDMNGINGVMIFAPVVEFFNGIQDMWLMHNDRGKRFVLENENDRVKTHYTLNQLLRANGLKQKDLAERVGTTEAAISRYVNGGRKPCLDMAIKISSALNVTVDEILWGYSYD